MYTIFLLKLKRITSLDAVGIWEIEIAARVWLALHRLSQGFWDVPLMPASGASHRQSQGFLYFLITPLDSCQIFRTESRLLVRSSRVPLGHCQAQPQLKLKLQLRAEVAILSAWSSHPPTLPATHLISHPASQPPCKVSNWHDRSKIELYIQNKSY